jgi:hypothetical protein
LVKVAEENGFKVRSISYWGLPLVPLLLARKTVRMSRADGRAGFDVKGRTINNILSSLARCEPLPQKFVGTSVMAVLENHSNGSRS